MKRLIFLSFVIVVGLSGCIFGKSTSTSQPKNTDGGVFISIDRGENWARKVFVRTEATKITTVASTNVGFFYFHPNASETIYLSTLDNGIWRTTDSGETWTQLGFTTGYIQGFDIDPKNTDIMYVGYKTTVMKSIDAGAKWETMYTNQPGNAITQVKVDPYDSRKIYATTSGGVILISEDQGQTWRILTQLANEVPKRLIILKSDSRIMFLITEGRILKSSDAGKTWGDSIQKGLDAVNANPVNDFKYLEREPSIMYVASNNGIFTSQDGGSTWRVIPTVIPSGAVPILAMAVNPFDEKEIYFTANSTFYKSTDSGVTWQTLKNVPSTRQFTVLQPHPRRPGMLLLGTFIQKKK
jgi:photosystem II stability/assembly factor-like uncharacterized protein